MSVVAILQARMGSTRFPGKVLATVAGRALFEHAVVRVARSSAVNRVVVATSETPDDDPIVAHCAVRGIDCRRGSLEDVLDRYYRVAAAVGASIVVRLTGDNPLVDPKMVDRLIRFREERALDYAANSLPGRRTVPYGLDVEVFTAEALGRAWATARRPSEREHVTIAFWRKPDEFRSGVLDWPRDASNFRVSVDHPEDLDVVRAILEWETVRGARVGTTEIVEFLESHPEIARLNSHFVPYAGWRSALDLDRALP